MSSTPSAASSGAPAAERARPTVAALGMLAESKVGTSGAAAELPATLGSPAAAGAVDGENDNSLRAEALAGDTDEIEGDLAPKPKKRPLDPGQTRRGRGAEH